MTDLLMLALDLAPVAEDICESPGFKIATIRRNDHDALWEPGNDPADRVYAVELIESNAGDVQFEGHGDTLDDAARALLRAMLAEVDRRATHPAVAAARAALAAAGSACRSDDDGDCRWNRCPQRLDGEPWVTGRHQGDLMPRESQDARDARAHSHELPALPPRRERGPREALPPHRDRRVSETRP